MVRLAIKPDVVGKRIELIRSEDAYSYLKPGNRGTVVDVSSYPMKICHSRFGFIGIVAQDFQSWKDKTIIGRFMMMTMIKYVLIISLIAALLPASIHALAQQQQQQVLANGTIVQNATVSPPSTMMEPRILANGTIVQNITGYLGVPTTIQLHSCPDSDFDGKCGVEKGQKVNRCVDNDRNYICEWYLTADGIWYKEGGVPVREKNRDYDNSKDSIRLHEHPNCNPEITNMPCYDVEDTRQEAGYGSMEGPYTENCDRVPCTPKEKQEFIAAGEKWPEQIYDEEHGKGNLYD